MIQIDNYFILIRFIFEVPIRISSLDIEVYGIGHPVVKWSLSIKVRTERFSECFGIVGWLVGWLVVFNVPSTARSFRDGTPIYCPLFWNSKEKDLHSFYA